MKRFAQHLSVLTVVLCLLMAGPLWAQGKVDINKADVETLKSLKGIGETRANAIIKYRQMNGPFQSLDDLKSVPGIGDKIVQDNKSKIAIGRGGKAVSKPKSKTTKDAKGKADKSMKSKAADKTKKGMSDSKDKAKKGMASSKDKAKKATGSSAKKTMKKSTSSAKSKVKKATPKSK